MCGPGGDVPEAETDEWRGVDTRPDHDPEIVRLLFASHAELDESVELGRVGGFEDVALDVGEPQDRGERRARHAPVPTLALPVRDPERLEALDRLRRQ